MNHKRKSTDISNFDSDPDPDVTAEELYNFLHAALLFSTDCLPATSEEDKFVMRLVLRGCFFPLAPFSLPVQQQLQATTVRSCDLTKHGTRSVDKKIITKESYLFKYETFNHHRSAPYHDVICQKHANVVRDSTLYQILVAIDGQLLTYTSGYYIPLHNLLVQHEANVNANASGASDQSLHTISQRLMTLLMFAGILITADEQRSNVQFGLHNRHLDWHTIVHLFAMCQRGFYSLEVKALLSECVLPNLATWQLLTLKSLHLLDTATLLDENLCHITNVFHSFLWDNATNSNYPSEMKYLLEDLDVLYGKFGTLVLQKCITHLGVKDFSNSYLARPTTTLRDIVKICQLLKFDIAHEPLFYARAAYHMDWEKIEAWFRMASYKGKRHLHQWIRCFSEYAPAPQIISSRADLTIQVIKKILVSGYVTGIWCFDSLNNNCNIPQKFLQQYLHILFPQLTPDVVTLVPDTTYASVPLDEILQTLDDAFGPRQSPNYYELNIVMEHPSLRMSHILKYSHIPWHLRLLHLVKGLTPQYLLAASAETLAQLNWTELSKMMPLEFIGTTTQHSLFQWDMSVVLDRHDVTKYHVAAFPDMGWHYFTPEDQTSPLINDALRMSLSQLINTSLAENTSRKNETTLYSIDAVDFIQWWINGKK